MAKRPAQRYASATELIEACRAVLTAEAAAVLDETPAFAPGRPLPGPAALAAPGAPPQGAARRDATTSDVRRGAEPLPKDIPPRAPWTARTIAILAALTFVAGAAGFLLFAGDGEDPRPPVSKPPPVSSVASRQFSAGLEDVFARLDKLRVPVRRQLAAARTARGQAARAQKIAYAYQRAAAALARLAPAAEQRKAADVLGDSLARAGRAYVALASAARSHNAKATRRAVARSRRARPPCGAPPRPCRISAPPRAPRTRRDRASRRGVGISAAGAGSVVPRQRGLLELEVDVTKDAEFRPVGPADANAHRPDRIQPAAPDGFDRLVGDLGEVRALTNAHRQIGRARVLKVASVATVGAIDPRQGREPLEQSVGLGEVGRRRLRAVAAAAKQDEPRREGTRDPERCAQPGRTRHGTRWTPNLSVVTDSPLKKLPALSRYARMEGSWLPSTAWAAGMYVRLIA